MNESEIRRVFSGAPWESPPARTMMEVQSLIDPGMRIEVEAEAVIPSS